MNGDVATALADGPNPWKWFGWRPRNLGYLACLVQLAGTTILFNFNTADAMSPGLSWQEQDLLIWTPNMMGSVCFLVASDIAYAEVSHGAGSFAPDALLVDAVDGAWCVLLPGGCLPADSRSLRYRLMVAASLRNPPGCLSLVNSSAGERSIDNRHTLLSGTIER
ncbi:MAG TPA: hypothetical protein EYQ60_13370 [Myxococcales bacterium]|nr:hypothetical protein [Myxococcales bacterium]